MAKKKKTSARPAKTFSEAVGIKNIFGDKRHQNFKQVHEQQHDYAKSVQSKTKTNAHRPTKKNHTGETQYHCMTCHHVSKETNHQSKRLGEHAEQLDDRHNWCWIGSVYSSLNFQSLRNGKPLKSLRRNKRRMSG